MPKIRIGMIGGGEGSFIGAIHYRAAMLDGNYELVCGAFSSHPERSKNAGARYHTSTDRTYSSWEEMFASEKLLPANTRMQAVIIATPNHLHFPQAMAALDYGFHVICDKPMTISLAEAKQLSDKVEEKKLVFGLTHCYTGYPMVKEARNIVQTGQLGKIRKLVVEYPQGWLSTPLEQTGNKQASWRLNPELSGPGGCLGDIGVHAENLAEYITGLTIDELCADVSSIVPNRQLDDDVSILLRFKGGAKGILYASQISAGEENALTIRVYGEKGGIEWHQMEPNTLLMKYLDRPTEILRAGANYTNLTAQTRWNLRLPGGHPEGLIEAFANIYNSIAIKIQSITDGTKLPTEPIDFPTVFDGYRGMKFIERAIESARSNEKWTKF